MKQVPPDDIPKIWGEQRERVLSALGRTQDRWHEKDVLAALLTDNRWNLWVHENAVVITRIVDYPRKRVCEVFLAAGEKMETWAHYESALCAWARSVGCHEADMQGRDGWSRVKTEGWEKKAIKMTKEL